MSADSDAEVETSFGEPDAAGDKENVPPAAGGAPAAPPAAEPAAPAASAAAAPAGYRGVSNVDFMDELVAHMAELKTTDCRRSGIFVGVNHFEVYRDGGRANKRPLTVVKSAHAWPQHLATLSAASLEAHLLLTEEGYSAHDVSIGGELFQCRFYGVDLADAPGDAGDPRAMLLPQVVSGLIFPHPYLYVYAHFQAMPEITAMHGDEPPPRSTAAEDDDDTATEPTPSPPAPPPSPPMRARETSACRREAPPRQPTPCPTFDTAVSEPTSPSRSVPQPERYVLVSAPSAETLQAAANDPELLKVWPFAATPELCTHEPSDDAPEVCRHSGYAIVPQKRGEEQTIV